MPKDYSKGKVYIIRPICEHDEGDVYIGSTTKDLLCKRMAEHRSNYKSWKNGKHNCVTIYDLFEKYGVDNCDIQLLETVCCNNFDELRAKEGYYQRTMKCVNKCIADRKKKEYQKQYAENNKEKFLEYRKEYYEENKEKIKEQKKKYRDEHKEQIKEYYETNKEILSHKKKQYYENNKEKILEQYLEQITCECGRIVTKIHLHRHKKSKIHNELINDDKNINPL